MNDDTQARLNDTLKQVMNLFTQISDELMLWTPELTCQRAGAIFFCPCPRLPGDSILLLPIGHSGHRVVQRGTPGGWVVVP